MIQGNIIKKTHGFTIVELLVVIVVIGILAAITIVSYTGITAKANTTKTLSAAQSAQQVAEIYNADLGYYPGTAAIFSAYTGTSKLPTGITAIPDNIGGTLITSTNGIVSATGVVTVGYSCLTACAATGVTGGRIAYWDFNGTPTVKYVYVGAATSIGTFAEPSS